MKNAIVMVALAASLAGAQPISISKTGQGPPLVFIPGLGCRAEVWRATVEQLSKRHLCVLVSIAGFGGLQADGPPDFGRVKSAIVEAAAREKWRSPVLIGHSFGGYLALSLAASHPDLFAKLVIVDAYPFPLGLMQPNLSPESARQQALALKGMTLGQMDAGFRQQQTLMLQMSVSDDAQAKSVLEWMLASDRATLAQAQYEMLSNDLRVQVGKITAPVLVLGTWAGRERLGFTRDKVEQWLKEQYRALPRSTIVVSDRARHFVMLDDPAWLADQIARFSGQ
ncbi:MAG: alpha/beta hydrolase [Bryobacteraceae bacterium]|jgi:pimeloyl-ACP methyl ester carboxylesterase